MDESPAIDLARVASELALRGEQVAQVVVLADEGNTVPFITRYRKERTGNLDEEQIRAVLARVAALRQLAERAATILRLIAAQGRLAPQLERAIGEADSLKRLEDLYLPFKPKKRTRAALARERGLEPLADEIWQQSPGLVNLDEAAAKLIDPARQLVTATDVLQGTSDLLAERISEDADLRASLRDLAWRIGRLATSATGQAEQTGQAYRDYFQHSEPASRVPPHRVLAINRGEAAGALRVRLDWDDAQAQNVCERRLGLERRRFAPFVRGAAHDALSRLIQPALEREVRRELTEQAEAHATAVFARNLRNLLLQPPLQGQRVMAVDPGFRTGCKVAVLDETGRCLATDVLYVTGSTEKRAAAQVKAAELLRAHSCMLVVIGNGTACRETEELVADMIAEHVPEARYVIVNEAGASIYSTSPAARDEFPDLDATVRGTISIGRRLQDPLSELVKIEPQHIGVGMYQHDIDARALQQALDQVIESCVNYVGVDLNTASVALLSHVSGLHQLTARRVVEWRTQHGPFLSREQLLKVSGVGPATYTQAAGFLKIRNGTEPLDGTWIHPESYPVARQVLARGGHDPAVACLGQLGDLRQKWAPAEVAELARELSVGAPTLGDIIDALSRPGRDPRTDLPGPIFKKGILKLEDLQPGMELQGTVLNVVDFGAFVDVGLKESGLVHISRMSTHFISSPHDVVSVGQIHTVWVLDVDHDRKRVSLSMVSPGDAAPSKRRLDSNASGSPPEQVASSRPISPSGTGSSPGAPAPNPRDPSAPARERAAPERHGPVNDAAPPAEDDHNEPLRSFDQLKRFWKNRPS